LKENLLEYLVQFYSVYVVSFVHPALSEH